MASITDQIQYQTVNLGYNRNNQTSSIKNKIQKVAVPVLKAIGFMCLGGIIGVGIYHFSTNETCQKECVINGEGTFDDSDVLKEAEKYLGKHELEGEDRLERCHELLWRFVNLIASKILPAENPQEPPKRLNS